TKMRVTRAVVLTPKISVNLVVEFAGKKIVAGISRVAEPVRLLHRLKSFWPRRQVLSLSCGLGWGVEILTRGAILHGRASSYQSRFQAEKSSKLRNQDRKGRAASCSLRLTND